MIGPIGACLSTGSRTPHDPRYKNSPRQEKEKAGDFEAILRKLQEKKN